MNLNRTLSKIFSPFHGRSTDNSAAGIILSIDEHLFFFPFSFQEAILKGIEGTREKANAVDAGFEPSTSPLRDKRGSTGL